MFLLMLALGVVCFAAGHIAGSTRTEREWYEAEERRDAQWDAEHFGGDRG